MDKAAARIERALAGNEYIAVYGDYDVDGITSTCLLTRYLRSRGGRVVPYIPDRLEEGYGLNREAVDALHAAGVTLIVTVDCGITAVEEVEYAKELGIDLVITDHHECKEELPAAVAVVDPHRKDCPYPFKDLAGVGVALKLVMALGGEKRYHALFQEYADLAAVGTVADVMKLLGENRTIVRVGLNHLKKTRRRGLYALMVEAGTLNRAINSTTVGYCLSPRINAAGRMGQAAMAVELILTENTHQAETMAHALCELNRQRQAVELEVFNQCLAMLAGCQGSGIQNQVTTVTYDHPESYTAGGGETTQPVERVAIDWYNGSVTVARHDGDAVAFSETANRTLEEGLTLRWRVEDGTLSLVYCQAGQVQLGGPGKGPHRPPPPGSDVGGAGGGHWGRPGPGVRHRRRRHDPWHRERRHRPPSLPGDGRGPRLDTGSGNITADLTGPLETLSADTGSGAVSLTAGRVSQCTVDTGSGAVSVTAETIETMEAGTGSGGVTLQADQLGTFTAEVGSGDVTLTAGAVDQAAVSAGSGGFTLTADQAPGALSVDLTSSPIRLTLPEEASFTATLDTVSGQWHCQLPATQQGDRYVCGTGEGTYRFSTTSGDVTIQALS